MNVALIVESAFPVMLTSSITFSNLASVEEITLMEFTLLPLNFLNVMEATPIASANGASVVMEATEASAFLPALMKSHPLLLLLQFSTV